MNDRTLAELLGRNTLDEAFMQTLFGLRSSSSVRAAQLDPNPVSKGKPGTVAPRGYDGGMEDGLERRYRGCRTNYDRLQVLRDAQEELRKIRYSPAPEQRKGTKEFKRTVALDMRQAGTVARVYGIPARTVRKYRRELKAGKLNA